MRCSRTLVLIATCAALATSAAGCAKPVVKPAEPPTSVIGATPTTPAVSTPASQPVAPSLPATTPQSSEATVVVKPKPVAGKPISAASRRYAKELGGVSHKGDTLYFIVGRNYKSEAAATKALKAARPYFGDMQDYFIVQRSDNFSGMRPGWWILVEGYRKASNAKSQREFAQRAFPSAYVKKATVKTADPIPVYEDLVDGVEQ